MEENCAAIARERKVHTCRSQLVVNMGLVHCVLAALQVVPVPAWGMEEHFR